MKTCKANLKEIESYGLKFYMTELNSITLEFHVEIVFIILDLAHQNQVYCTQDVSFLNSFENMLANEIV